jgi:glycosyltransferase involved in cell wall biosynthesis
VITPRVSVFLFCKDRAASIRRSVESVLAQSLRDFEYVIQDGASTDGTLEILREYDDPRIALVSEPDDGAADAFWPARRRTHGRSWRTADRARRRGARLRARPRRLSRTRRRAARQRAGRSPLQRRSRPQRPRSSHRFRTIQASGSGHGQPESRIDDIGLGNALRR